MYGLEKFIQNPIKGNVTLLQFIKYQGLLVTVTDCHFIIWNINSASVACGPISLPGIEYFLRIL